MNVDKYPPVRFSEAKLHDLGFERKETYDKEFYSDTFDSYKFVEFSMFIDKKQDLEIVINQTYHRENEQAEYKHISTSKFLYNGSEIYLHNLNGINILKKLIEVLKQATSQEE